jgi:hypothetical protein
MWAISISAHSHIAVVAEQSVAVRIALTPDPVIEISSIRRLSFLRPATVNVVQGKEFLMCLAATCTLAAISRKHI